MRAAIIENESPLATSIGASAAVGWAKAVPAARVVASAQAAAMHDMPGCMARSGAEIGVVIQGSSRFRAAAAADAARHPAPRTAIGTHYRCGFLDTLSRVPGFVTKSPTGSGGQAPRRLVRPWPSQADVSSVAMWRSARSNRSAGCPPLMRWRSLITIAGTELMPCACQKAWASRTSAL